MPYYITDEAAGCAGWATIKEDGEVMGCHQTKQAAINQGVAIAQAEGSTFEGERNLDELLEDAPGGGLPDNYRPATSDDVPEGRACGNCVFFNEEKLDAEGRAWCEWWEAYAAGGFYCNAWQGREGRPYHDDEDEDRVAPDGVKVGDFVSWDSSGGRARGRITRIVRSGTLNVPDADFTLNADEDNPAALIRVYRPKEGGWEPSGPLVGHRFSTLTKIDPLPEPSDREDRQVDLSVPAYIRAAARQGLEFHRDGKSGSGVVPRTIREASAMAEGNVSDDKVVRAAAWAARHRPDLNAEGARPGQDGYPTPGAVAHLLWGIPTGGRYDDAVAWFNRKSEQVKADRGAMMDVTPVEPRTPGSGVEFRSTTFEMRNEPDENTFVGYAAMFDSPSQPLPFVERIERGAFERSLRERRRDIRLYVNHNSDLVLASKRSGTLRLTEDDRGLRVDADLPDTTYANDLRALMRAGVVDKMSFGFTVPKGGDRWSADGGERTLTKINLHEVSVVTGFPAYEQTQAAVRSLERLSDRTGLAIGDLTSALDALADGDELDPEKAELLMSAIKESSGVAPKTNLIGLKQKHVDLLAKKVW